MKILNEYGNAFVIFLAVAIILVMTFCYNGGYKSGYEDSINENGDYYTGYESGYDEGYFDGVNDGHEEGYEEGRESGWGDGYSVGADDGFYDGATYTCLFFGDIDRAFRSAENGFSWHIFVEAYDEYVDNIYNSDEERATLVWSLMGAVNGEVTKEEEDALIQAFGEDLFIRNEVSWSIVEE